MPTESPRPLRFALAVFDGVDELDVIGPLSVLRRAARLRNNLRITLAASGPDMSFITDHDVRMLADEPLQARPDVLIVPGGGWASGAATGVRAEIARGALASRIASAHAAGSVVASVCTGALIVAAAGIAKGRRMSTHHLAREALAEHGVIVVRDRVFDDGTIISAGGVTSGIDLGLYLVRRYFDANLSAQIADRLEYGVANV